MLTIRTATIVASLILQLVVGEHQIEEGEGLDGETSAMPSRHLQACAATQQSKKSGRPILHAPNTSDRLKPDGFLVVESKPKLGCCYYDIISMRRKRWLEA